MLKPIDIPTAQREAQRLVCLADIAVRYMQDPEYASETREHTLSYLADLLIEQAVAVETALQAAPSES